MGNFRAGEVVIYVGDVVEPFCIGRIQKGDEVTLVKFLAIGLWLIDRTTADGLPMATSPKFIRKRPDDSQQRFRDTLKPCDKDFRHDLATWLRSTETEVKEGLKGILQPFDNFYEGYDQ